MDKLDLETPDLTNENIEKIGELFPQVITEAEDEKGELRKAIDFDALRQELSHELVEGNKERYQFTWPGKQAAKLEARRPINKTLRPCRDESVDFDTTENLYIEGDNLDALKLLRNTYAGKIKMIYIDPPYNTGRNYIYRNDYSVSTDRYLKATGAISDGGARMVANPRTYGRFHSAWLSTIYSRVLVARSLLSKDGVLVCAIDENEFASLSTLLKEIFGESNYEHSYVSVLHNPRGQQGVNFSYVNEYLIFVYPSDGKKYLADFPKEEIDSRNLRDSGSESDRTDARSCFYPFYVKDELIIDIGDVPSSDFHPSSANVDVGEGVLEIWPLTDDGKEKKWRYARQSVEAILEKLVPKMGRENMQVIYNKDEGTMRSVWANPKYDSSEYGTKLLDKLLGGASFTFPKSLYAVSDCVRAVTKDDKDAIVMDFFSGSATTAHAVMLMNHDGGKRRHIMVQIPENLDEALLNSSDAKTKASISGAIQFLDSIDKPHTICEIGKERIRRAGVIISEEVVPPLHAIDKGFRVLKIDSSNFKQIHKVPADTNQNELFREIDNVEENRTPEDILFEVLPKLRIPLTAIIATETIDAKQIFNVNNGQVIACFDPDISTRTIEMIAKRKPVYAIILDSSLRNDATEANFEELFKTYSPDTVRKVI